MNCVCACIYVYIYACICIYTHTQPISFKCCTTKKEVEARHRDTQRLRQEACCKYKLAVLHSEYWASEDYRISQRKRNRR